MAVALLARERGGLKETEYPMSDLIGRRPEVRAQSWRFTGALGAIGKRRHMNRHRAKPWIVDSASSLDVRIGIFEFPSSALYLNRK